MIADAASNAVQLELLIEQHTEQKLIIKDAQDTLADIEQSIISHPELPSLPQKGTTDCGTFKVITGWNRRWNQNDLATLFWNLKKERGELPFWPFKSEFKEIASTMTALKEGDPDLAKLIEDTALSVSPKKPVIQAIEEKD